jgi:hypothetical protein
MSAKNDRAERYIWEPGDVTITQGGGPVLFNLKQHVENLEKQKKAETTSKLKKAMR